MKRSWADKLYLSQEELQLGLGSVELFNWSSIWFSSGTARLVYSDASGSGYGGYVVELCNDVAQGHWSWEEAALSSTWRELKAVYVVLLLFAKQLAGHTVKWFTDNLGVVSIIASGSRRQHLQDGAMAIFEMYLQYSIKQEMECVMFNVGSLGLLRTPKREICTERTWGHTDSIAHAHKLKVCMT